MPFDWREFLLVAYNLRNDTAEGAQRTCIGRTYYYVYNLGLIKARALNFQGTPPSLHKQLWTWCQKHTDVNVKQMGVWGGRMLSLRHDADYKDAPIPNLVNEVQAQLARAQRFEALVAASSNQPPPTPLTLP